MKIELPNIQLFVKPEAIGRVGFYAISLIKNRTDKGLDAKKKDFKPYSTRPFAMPYGFLKKQKTLVDKFERTGEMQFFRREGKSTWVVVKKGYSFYKENFSRNFEGGKVNLKLSGEMMKAVTVISADAKSFTIGWVRADLAERAYWNEEKGREFLGLSDDDLQLIYEYIKDDIDVV